MTKRLAEDHRRARLLAGGLASLPGILLDPGTPRTNMVFCSLAEDVPLDSTRVAAALAERGVLVGAVGARRFRLVTHYWIGDDDVPQAVEAFRQVLETR
jgi:threonine aldolase